MKKTLKKSIAFFLVFLAVSFFPIILLKLLYLFFPPEIAAVLSQFKSVPITPPLLLLSLFALVFILFAFLETRGKLRLKRWQKRTLIAILITVSAICSLAFATVNGVPVFVIIKALLEVAL